jgi:hypothetical protein
MRFLPSKSLDNRSNAFLIGTFEANINIFDMHFKILL